MQAIQKNILHSSNAIHHDRYPNPRSSIIPPFFPQWKACRVGKPPRKIPREKRAPPTTVCGQVTFASSSYSIMSIHETTKIYTRPYYKQGFSYFRCFSPVCVVVDIIKFSPRSNPRANLNRCASVCCCSKMAFCNR